MEKGEYDPNKKVDKHTTFRVFNKVLLETYPEKTRELLCKIFPPSVVYHEIIPHLQHSESWEGEYHVVSIWPKEKWQHAYGDDRSKWDADDHAKHRREYPELYRSED